MCSIISIIARARAGRPEIQNQPAIETLDPLAAISPCYFTSKGSEAETRAFVDAIADTIEGPVPPMMLVPQPHMHTDDVRVQIWGIAQG